MNSVYVGTDAPHGHFELVAEIQVDPTYCYTAQPGWPGRGVGE